MKKLLLTLLFFGICAYSYAGTKITGLPTVSSNQSTDLGVIVTNPSTNPVTNVIPLGSLTVGSASQLSKTPIICLPGKSPQGILQNGDATGCATGSGGGSGNVDIGTSGNPSYYTSNGNTVGPFAGVTYSGINVGIGTSNPGGNLDVSTGTICLNHVCNSSWPSGITYPGAGIANSTGSAWGLSYSTNGTGTVVALTNSPNFTGNVGIGTTLPNRILTTASNSSNTSPTSASTASIGIDNTNTTTNNTNDLAFDASDGTNMVLGAKITSQFTSHTNGAVSADLLFLNKNAGTTQQNVVIKSNGNVGIGTSTPNYATLTTYGNNYATDIKTPNLIMGRTATYGICDDPNGGGCLVWQGADRNVGIGSVYPGSTLDIAGTARMTGFTLSGNSATTNYVLTATDSSGDSAWSPSTGSNYWLLKGGVGNVGITTTGTVGIGTTGAGNGQLIVMGGNVGIGSANPTQALDVNGTVKATAFSGTASIANALASATTTVNVSSATAPTSGQVLTASSGTAAAWQTSSGSNFWFSGSGAGNVGVGTTASVGIGTTLGTGAGLVVMNGNVGIGTWITGGVLDVETTPGTHDIVDNGGNVGIGTSTPTVPQLFVVHSTGTNGFFVTSNGNVGIGNQATVTGATIMNGGTTINSSFVLSNNSSNTWTGTSASNTALAMTANSLTGGHALTISGNNTSQTGDMVDITQTGAGATATGLRIAMTGTGPALTTVGNVGIGTTMAGTTGSFEVYGGNVGIGTATPGVALDVKGDIRDNDFSGQASGTIMCVKTGGAMGYCSGTIVGVGCTCN